MNGLNKSNLLSAQASYKNQVQLYTLVAGIVVLVLIAGLLWRNNRHKQKAKLKIEESIRKIKTYTIPTDPIRKNGFTW